MPIPIPSDTELETHGAELGLSADDIVALKRKAAECRRRDDEPMTPEEIADIQAQISNTRASSISRTPWPSAVAFAHLDAPSSRDRRLLLAYPQTLFRPEGLWLWGADETTLVHDIKVGNLTGFTLSHVALPGLFFEAGCSFEDFQKLLEAPPEDWSHARLRERPSIPSHQKIRLNIAEIGNNILIDLEGPLTHAVMWGMSVS
jgi:hypothetical protein